MPTDADIYPTKSYAKNALVQPEPRALFRRLLDQGWIDAIRTLHPDEPMYTFWDYKRNRWERDAGLRLDHLLLNAKAAKRLVDAGVDREVRGLEGASDHAPAWIVLRDTPATRRKPARRSEKLTRPKSRRSTQRAAPLPRRPLLVIDGDSFAHRSYHALPKTILRRGRKPAHSESRRRQQIRATHQAARSRRTGLTSAFDPKRASLSIILEPAG